jgi:hypothetical protein
MEMNEDQWMVYLTESSIVRMECLDGDRYDGDDDVDEFVYYSGMWTSRTI